jgi:large conductance mechanosensitive channel
MALNKAQAEMEGFKTFLVKQNVVGLAVGVIVGGAASKLVGSLVENILNPLIGLVMQSKDSFSAYVIGPVKIGAFVGSLIDFIILLAVVYFVINKAVSMLFGTDLVAEKK